jgi:hypothetical protein
VRFVGHFFFGVNIRVIQQELRFVGHFFFRSNIRVNSISGVL